MCAKTIISQSRIDTAMMNEKALGFLISEGQWWKQKKLMWVTKPKLNINRWKLRREANGQKTHVHQSLRTTWKDFLTVPVQLSWSGCGQEPNVMQYQLSWLPGARGKGLLLLWRKDVPFPVRGKRGEQRICAPMFFVVLGLLSILHVNHTLFVQFCY